uniref:Uncharacterized protein n=1 Tax=Arundo donax TaxID=35708 RepID=A0A0A8ZLE4_ARUDO
MSRRNAKYHMKVPLSVEKQSLPWVLTHHN